MNYFQVPAAVVAEFTHYKSRSGLPWIKLHRQWLDDYEFTRLPLAQRGILMHLWLLAARMENRIPDDPDWLAHTLRADPNDFDIGGFVEKGFLEYIAEAAPVGDAGKEPPALPAADDLGDWEDEEPAVEEPAIPVNGPSSEASETARPIENVRSGSTRTRKVREPATPFDFDDSDEPTGNYPRSTRTRNLPAPVATNRRNEA